MRINQNPAAFAAYKSLTTISQNVERTMERLSSGQRINRATDDAAVLVRSETLRSQISSTIQATQNAQDGVSFLQTTEGALGEIQALLQRMRTIAVDAANRGTTNGAAQQMEFTELAAEIEAIGDRSAFGGIDSFQDFSVAPLVFQIGTESGPAQRMEINLDLRTTIADLAGGALVGADLSLDPDAALAALDVTLAEVSSLRGDLGAKTSRLEHTIDNLLVARENLTASESRIRDADMALEMVALTSAQVLSQASTAMLGQANTMPSRILDLLN